jgi:hypothetical protein
MDEVFKKWGYDLGDCLTQTQIDKLIAILLQNKFN